MEKPKYSRTKPNSNISNNPALQRILEGKLQGSGARKVPAPKKEQDIKHLITKPKGENHKHIKPPTKTNIRNQQSPLLYSSQY